MSSARTSGRHCSRVKGRWKPAPRSRNTPLLFSGACRPPAKPRQGCGTSRIASRPLTSYHWRVMFERVGFVLVCRPERFDSHAIFVAGLKNLRPPYVQSQPSLRRTKSAFIRRTGHFNTPSLTLDVLRQCGCCCHRGEYRACLITRFLVIKFTLLIIDALSALFSLHAQINREASGRSSSSDRWGSCQTTIPLIHNKR